MNKKKERILRPEDFVSTGSTLLNLGLTGHPNRGFIKGKYFFLVGDSTSGKTFLSLTCLAEAAKNSNFKDYQFIYDGVEGGALMNIERFFGKVVWNRLRTPNMFDEDRPSCSTTIEGFFYNIDDAFGRKKPFIYILDSMDALSSEYEQDKFVKAKTATRKGKSDELAGSFGDGKAKKNAAGIRQLLGRLETSRSILIIINQTRDNLGFGFKKKTRSGGHALKFYATAEIWSSVKGKIKKTIKGRERIIGSEVQLKIEKNRINGWEDKIGTPIPIYRSMGIDDVGSCVDYLVNEKHWYAKGGKIKADEFDFIGTRQKLINQIEEENAEFDLRDITGEIWNEIEDACKVQRKQRYE